MKILYAVQGTGNGHISRSRSMAVELKNANIEVDYLFSGREESNYFDMEIFGNAIYKKGLTFVINNGKVDIWKTILHNDQTAFLRDIDHLDLSPYDLVISDYEPIAAWAARLQNKPCIGIGHQYAFNHNIPVSHSNMVTRFIMKWFAPASFGIGLHWHHFNQPILPPIIDALPPGITINNKIVVYLAFEDPAKVHEILSNFPGYTFHVYGGYGPRNTDHIWYKAPSRDGFKDDLLTCDGVLCNSGFELVSEALTLGKKVLVNPVHGQMEQHSNALALKILNYGETMDTLDTKVIGNWLKKSTVTKIEYPNVAEFIVEWLQKDITKIPFMDCWRKI